MLFLANATKIDVSYSALSQTKPDIICYRKGELKLVWNQLIIQCISFPLLLPVWTQLQSHAQPSDSYVLLAQNVTSSSNLLIITSLYMLLAEFWMFFQTFELQMYRFSPDSFIQSCPHANVFRSFFWFECFLSAESPDFPLLWVLIAMLIYSLLLIEFALLPF